VWGLDLVGPLQKALGGFSHLLVAIDKFSKWIEVRPLTSIRSEQVERANGMILQGLKPMIYNDLNKFDKWWMKELPSVV
jgi:hypothetical protein